MTTATPIGERDEGVEQPVEGCAGEPEHSPECCLPGTLGDDRFIVRLAEEVYSEGWNAARQAAAEYEQRIRDNDPIEVVAVYTRHAGDVLRGVRLCDDCRINVNAALAAPPAAAPARDGTVLREALADSAERAKATRPGPWRSLVKTLLEAADEYAESGGVYTEWSEEQVVREARALIGGSDLNAALDQLEQGEER